MRSADLMTTVLALGLVAWSPATTAAQTGVALEGQGGVAVPLGQLGEFTDTGASLGAGIAFWFVPRVAVRADFDLNALKGKPSSGPGPEGPDVTLFHYNAGLQLRLTDPRTSRWEIALNAGAGGTTLDSDEFEVIREGDIGEPTELKETYFALNGGLGIGYRIAPNLTLFVDGQWYAVLTEEDDTKVFAEINPRVDEDGFGTASVIPITLGFRLRTS